MIDAGRFAKGDKAVYVTRFIKAVYPENTELVQAMATEESILTDAAAVIDEQRALIARLCEALEPFAHCQLFDDATTDYGPNCCSGCRAKVALAAVPQARKGETA